MVKRLLESQHDDPQQSQRENIFHTRCKVCENTYSMIVDSGSFYNYCSSRLVDKLALIVAPHLKPYKFQWIKKDE